MADALSPSIYAFHSHSVRIVMRDGEPWFVATDVASALGYSSPKDAAEHLDADEKGSATTRTPGGDQKVTVINESGLYALVLRSRKPEARKFAKWVTSEVLPSIRKTGRYEKPGREMTVNEMVEKMTRQVSEPNGHPALLFMPLVNAVLKKSGLNLAVTTGAASDFLPEAQATEITERLDRLSQLFHPLSQPFSDVMGVMRALRGLHPKLGMYEASYRQVLPRPDAAVFRQTAPGVLVRA